MGDASIVHYIFCFFSAHLLMEIKLSLIDRILLINLRKKFKKDKRLDKKKIRLYINLINAGFDFVLIIIIIFLIITRKKYIKRKRLLRGEIDLQFVNKKKLKSRRKRYKLKN